MSFMAAMASPKEQGRGAISRLSVSLVVLIALLAQIVLAQPELDCDCDAIGEEVEWDPRDPTKLPSGLETVSDPSCVLPCRLVELEIPMGPYDLADVQYNCAIGPIIPENKAEFEFFDASRADRCENPPKLLSGPSCAEGFLCRFTVEVCNMNEWPQYCIPEEVCAITLLRGNTCSRRTNQHQPMVCPQGAYCPRFLRHNSTENQRNPCPVGSYCPLGSDAPIECEFLSYCDEEELAAPRQLGMLAIVVVIDMAFAIFLCIRTGRKGPLQRKLAAASDDEEESEADVARRKKGVRKAPRDTPKATPLRDFQAAVYRVLLRLFPKGESDLVYPPEEALQRQVVEQSRHTRGRSLFDSTLIRADSVLAGGTGGSFGGSGTLDGGSFGGGSFGDSGPPRRVADRLRKMTSGRCSRRFKKVSLGPGSARLRNLSLDGLDDDDVQEPQPQRSPRQPSAEGLLEGGQHSRGPSWAASDVECPSVDPSVHFSDLSTTTKEEEAFKGNPLYSGAEEAKEPSAPTRRRINRTKGGGRANTVHGVHVPRDLAAFASEEGQASAQNGGAERDGGDGPSGLDLPPGSDVLASGAGSPEMSRSASRKRGVHFRDPGNVEHASEVIGKFVTMKRHKRSASTPIVRGSLMPDVYVPTTLDAAQEDDAYHVALQKLNLGFVRARACVFSLDFQFENLSMTLPTGKCILSSVSGRIEPAKVTAIMGPSGAGKTTFVNVLMSKVPSAFRRSGELRINGAKLQTSVFRKAIGYVPQDDIMHRSLSVRENVLYAARVRAPRHWKKSQVLGHVDAVLRVLDLHHVQHTMIGDEETRGISGGQRKRVNIGMELAACPVALFLDEPTSGLDSTSALSVIQALKDISRSTGITVAMVVHQPRREIWDALDQLLLLAPGGRTVFQGPQDDVDTWFSTALQLAPSVYENPADYYMDVVGRDAERCVTAWIEMNKYEPMSEEERKRGDEAVQAGLRRLSRRPSIAYVKSAIGGILRRPSNSSSDVMDSAPGGGESKAASVPRPSLPESPTPRRDGRRPIRRERNEFDRRRQRIGSWSAFDLDLDDHPDGDEVRQSFATFIGLNVSEDLKDATAHGVSIGKSGVARILRKYGAAGNVHQQADFMVRLHAKAGSNVLYADDIAGMCREMTRPRNGASWLAQFGHAHSRALRLWFASPKAVASELITVSVAGVVIGFASSASFRGILISPYTLLSPAAEDFVLPLAGMLIIIGCGISAVPAGVSVFGGEKVIYWREASVGHSRTAYFAGVSTAAMYRVILAGCHFAATFAAVSKADIMTSVDTLTLSLLAFFCMHGLANFVSMLMGFESAMLVSVVLSLLVPIIGGLIPSIPVEAQSVSFGRPINEAVFSLGTVHYRHLYFVEEFADFYLFVLDQVLWDKVLAVCHGLAFRLIAFLAMVLLNRDKQR